MPELGVNIDHVATVRQARQTNEPDPVWAATLAELGGADGITIHLREDRRHIQDRDLRLLRETVAVKLNLEMACADEMVRIACEVRPPQATLEAEGKDKVTWGFSFYCCFARATHKLNKGLLFVQNLYKKHIDLTSLPSGKLVSRVPFSTAKFTKPMECHVASHIRSEGQRVDR